MKCRNLILIIFTFISILILLNTSCTKPISNTVSAGTQTISPSVLSGTVRDIDVNEAYKIIQNNSTNPDFVILDVRTPEEYNSGHIAKAINIDIKSSNFNSAIGQFAKDKTYLVYCQMGGRSFTATRIMLRLGFNNILNLKEGLAKWTENKYPVENEVHLQEIQEPSFRTV